MEAEKYVSDLIAKSSKAQKIIANYSQEEIDELTGVIAWNALDEDFREKAANMMVEESGIGSINDKFNKIQVKTKGLYNQMRDEKSVGIVEENPRSEEHTSELQSRGHIVCRLLLDKKK